MTKAREIAELGQKLTVDASGNLEFAGDLELGDNNKAIFGAGNDLQIYHDRYNSYIDEVGNGSLRIRGYNQVRITDTSDNIAAIFKGDAESTLYHNNSPKLSTTSTGIDVTGNANFADNGKAIFGAGSDLQIYHDGSNSYIDENGVGNLFIRSVNGASARIYSGGTASSNLRLLANSGGEITLYHSGSAKLATTSTGISVTGNATFADNGKAVFGAGSDLQIYHDGNDKIVSSSSFMILEGSNIILRNNGGTEDYAKFFGDGAVELYSDNSKKLATTSTGVDITGDVGADTATITGKTTTDELDLSPIASTISDTAVDIFVYDTRKDSDGGAWRKRTQHTSWYNETLNTATRGSRKEFPSVAVIVGTSTKLTIYDGDDPDLPMWMVFDANVSASDLMRNNGIDCIAARNGSLVIGLGNGFGLIEANMVADYGFHWTSTANAGYYNSYIADRNQASNFTRNIATPIVDNYTNDVAMTVLPNAPIDAATGLPVPTIAVATAGGVSVIKDDGTVVDDTTFSPINVLSFSIDNDVFFGRNGYGRVYKWDYSADTSSTATYVTNATTPPIAGNTNGGIVDFGNDEYWASGGSTDGLNVFAENKLAANITSDFNTGWMNGDIKLATLSDTDDTDVTGSELSSDTWAAAGGYDNTVTSISASAFSSVYNTTQNRVYVVVNTVVGETYTFTATKTSGGNAIVYVREGSAGSGTIIASATAANYHSITFTATTVTTSILFRNDGSDYAYEDISVRLAEEDRSVNGNGLQVFGTVTKNPVATGADLVGYSGFSNSNHLTQPYNSDLDYGTGDFAFCAWFKSTNSGNSEYIIDRRDSAGTGNKIIIFKEGTTNKLRVFASATGNTTTSGAINTGAWTQVWFVRRSGTTYAFINGELSDTFTNQAGTVTNTSATLCVGDTNSHSGNAFVRGSVALVRTSATAPSPEQIKKIYEDEKVLFQENAQATLYGSSDAVTALAYDDSTELLHVGTSAGRSVFQGLRRVDNTTTAVGAAISASNGLVADE